jgi:signal peptidase I
MNRIIVVMVLFVLVGFGCVSHSCWMKMSTSSMEPTIHLGDKVFIDKDISRYTPERFDVILIRLTEIQQSDQIIIKRIIGLPGEEVFLNKGKLTINGNLVKEPFDKTIDVKLYNKLIVPADSVFVLGDNRARSRDSRHFGAIPIKSIIGKVARNRRVCPYFKE